jgi:hypothetical protein
MITKRSLFRWTALALTVSGVSAVAQISLSPGNLTYTQDFDVLIRTTTAEAWGNNTAAISVNDAPRQSGLPGWYAAGTSSSYVPQIRASNGGTSTGSFYSYGSTGDADRALGTLPSGTPGSLRLGVRFVNDTGEIVDGFTFSYDGEQWREGGVTNVNNQLVPAYATFNPGTGSLSVVGVFNNVNDAIFNSPVDGSTASGAALDGNLGANRIANLGATITGLALMPGDEIWLRWFDSDSSGADHGLAIDNFSIAFTTAVPEPAAATLLGLGLMTLLGRRRRQV